MHLIVWKHATPLPTNVCQSHFSSIKLHPIRIDKNALYDDRSLSSLNVPMAYHLQSYIQQRNYVKFTGRKTEREKSSYHSFEEGVSLKSQINSNAP